MGRASRRTQGVLGGRSAVVVRRVMAAALGELARSGYHGFRMEVVAERAGVNKTTIYRRWPDRAALIGAVVERMRAPLRRRPLPDTGSVETDLIEAFARRAAVGRKTEGRAWARLIEERARPEVEAIVGAAVAERREEWHAMVKRGIARKELPPGTDVALVFELVRAIVDARPSTTAWMRIAVRTVLAGARAGVLTRRRETTQRRVKTR